MTPYNIIRREMLVRWDGHQPATTINLRTKAYSAWWQIGMDMQQSQKEICKNELGTAVVLLLNGCTIGRNGIAKEERLQVMPAEEIPELFRQRAVEYLGTEDIVVLHDVGAAEFLHVNACAVPGEWWRGLATAPLSSPQGGKDEANGTYEPNEPEQLEIDFGEDYDVSETSQTSEPERPLAAPTRTADPEPTIDNPVPSHREQPKKDGLFTRMLMVLAQEENEAQYCKKYSYWSGQMETRYDPSVLMKIYIVGLAILCFVGYFPCMSIIDAGCPDFAKVIMPIVILLSFWTALVLYVAFRVWRIKKNQLN